MEVAGLHLAIALHPNIEVFSAGVSTGMTLTAMDRQRHGRRDRLGGEAMGDCIDNYSLRKYIRPR